MIQLLKTEIKRKSESSRVGKHRHIMYRRAKTRMTVNFSSETTQAFFLSSTERIKGQPRILYPVKISFKNKD